MEKMTVGRVALRLSGFLWGRGHRGKWGSRGHRDAVGQRHTGLPVPGSDGGVLTAKSHCQYLARWQATANIVNSRHGIAWLYSIGAD
jgi:hypothetical protein